MSFLSFVSVLLILCVGAFTLYTNRDIFSPSKLFLGFITLFHMELLILNKPLEYYLSFFILVLLSLFFSIYESGLKQPQKFSNQYIEHKKTSVILIVTIWIFSLVPILAQLLLILESGGIIQYLNDVIYRAELWRGKGVILTLIQTMQVLNVIYFAVGLYWKYEKKLWWALYIFHFISSFSIGILTGSRSVMLMSIIIMLIVFHYLKRRIKLRNALVLMISLLVMASIVGLARNNFKIEDGVVTTGITASPQKVAQLSSSFRYGIIPLDFVYAYEPLKLQYGAGLITPVTNLVPRNIWPKKPDTSSMAMNKEYVEDRGPGPYEYPSGIIGLGIMNFGWVIGIPFAFLLLSFFYILSEYSYRKHIILRNSNEGFHGVLKLIIAVYFIQLLPALVIGEFSNTLHAVFLTKITPVLFFLILYRLLPIKYRKLR